MTIFFCRKYMANYVGYIYQFPMQYGLSGRVECLVWTTEHNLANKFDPKKNLANNVLSVYFASCDLI